MAGRKKIGLALGSGSARGWSHIGVLQALEQNEIPIDYIAGTSIGSFVGAVYATGKIDSLREFALGMNWKMVLSYFDVVFPKSGFLDGKKIHDLFSMHTSARTFDDFQIPVRMVATDLDSGQEVILDSGNIIDSIRASVSVPGVITPVRRGDKLLIDGGLVNPVPVDVVRSMGANIVIAVNLNSGLVSKRSNKKTTVDESDRTIDETEIQNEWIGKLAHSYNQAERLVREKINLWFEREEEAKPNIMEIMGASLDIMEEKIAATNLELHQPDILITPRLADLKMFDFDQAERSIEEGYQRAMEQMPEIKNLIKAD